LDRRHIVKILAVFDHEVGFRHSPTGRVAVNLKYFERDTEYTLRYWLCNSENITERQVNEQDTVWIRIDIFDGRGPWWPPSDPGRRCTPKWKEKGFRMVRYTCLQEMLEATSIKDMQKDSFRWCLERPADMLFVRKGGCRGMEEIFREGAERPHRSED